MIFIFQVTMDTIYFYFLFCQMSMSNAEYCLVYGSISNILHYVSLMATNIKNVGIFKNIMFLEICTFLRLTHVYVQTLEVNENGHFKLIILL